jgi:hypothetical protein
MRYTKVHPDHFIQEHWPSYKVFRHGYALYPYLSNGKTKGDGTIIIIGQYNPITTFFDSREMHDTGLQNGRSNDRSFKIFC